MARVHKFAQKKYQIESETIALYGQTLTFNDQPVIQPSTTINGESGAITLAAGTNMTLVESPDKTFTLNAAGGGSGFVKTTENIQVNVRCDAPGTSFVWRVYVPGGSFVDYPFTSPAGGWDGVVPMTCYRSGSIAILQVPEQRFITDATGRQEVDFTFPFSVANQLTHTFFTTTDNGVKAITEYSVLGGYFTSTTYDFDNYGTTYTIIPFTEYAEAYKLILETV